MNFDFQNGGKNYSKDNNEKLAADSIQGFLTQSTLKPYCRAAMPRAWELKGFRVSCKEKRKSDCDQNLKNHVFVQKTHIVSAIG